MVSFIPRHWGVACSGVIFNPESPYQHARLILNVVRTPLFGWQDHRHMNKPFGWG